MFSLTWPIRIRGRMDDQAGVTGTHELLYGREIIHGNDVDIFARNIGVMAYSPALNLFPRLAHET
jgi:hypothetical protein